MVESNKVIIDIQHYFDTEITARVFRLKIKHLCQELGILLTEKPPRINAYLAKLQNDLKHTATRQEQQRLSSLISAFSQLKDSSRTQAKRDLVTAALSAFYTLSTIPELGRSGSFSHKQIRSLAFLGLAAAYHELEDSDELIAEKLTMAIYEDSKTAAQFLDRSYFDYFKEVLGLFADDLQFTVNGGLATDTLHGLTWLRFALGQEWYHELSQGRLARYTWKEAFSETEIFNEQGGYDGYTDWRLPSIEELKTLIDLKEGDAKKSIHFINNRVFPRNYDLFWSSSSSSYNDNVAWIVDFNNGSAFYGNINYGYGVRLVRSS
ncbi:MAG: DUF1566 domain-containing protein [Methylobacter sp.]|uniref:Lcl C-terminal domain-containing protein n=1 Tax=Methylovulum miyakonense TaxID=645578 RepID=UPI0003682521|nr:DUF1566 domain-containing protein [Methylovulum miyakonense]PPD38559.1 MAG: DUF1566 domain-containing protein [Methylobacter sp.]